MCVTKEQSFWQRWAPKAVWCSNRFPPYWIIKSIIIQDISNLLLSYNAFKSATFCLMWWPNFTLQIPVSSSCLFGGGVSKLSRGVFKTTPTFRPHHCPVTHNCMVLISLPLKDHWHIFANTHALQENNCRILSLSLFFFSTSHHGLVTLLLQNAC